MFSFINCGITAFSDSQFSDKTLAEILQEKESNEGSDQVFTKKDYGNQGNLKPSLKKQNDGREKKIKKVNFQRNIATQYEANDPKYDNMPEVCYNDPPLLYENDEKSEIIKEREDYLKLSVGERLKKYSKNIAPLHHAVNLLNHKEKREKLVALIEDKKFNQIPKNRNAFLELESDIGNKLRMAPTNEELKSQKKYLDDLFNAGYLRLIFAVELCSKIKSIYKKNTEDKDYMKKYCVNHVNANNIDINLEKDEKSFMGKYLNYLKPNF